MLLTVAICTFNRAESLRTTLDSLILSALRIPTDLLWEVVIVNNNSTDHTDKVIDEYRAGLPIRREFEPQQGHCHARNRAVDSAQGDYIIWTDDDVLIDPGWLNAYLDAIRQWPDAAIFGGPIIPLFEPPSPKWLSQSYDLVSGAFAARDLGKSISEFSIAGNHLPYGANFVLRMAEQRRFRYNPELGYLPGRKRTYDEIDVIARILQAGGIGYWIPEAKVEHRIDKDRQTIKYLVNYFTTQGETAAFLWGPGGPRDKKPPMVFGVPRWLWLMFFKHRLRYWGRRVTSPAPIWIGDLCKWAYAKGAIDHWRRQ